MGAFFTGLAWFVGAFAATTAFRVLGAIGIGYVSYEGLSSVVDPMITQINQNVASLGGFGPYVGYSVSALRVIPSISVVTGAIAMALAIRIATSVGRRAL